MSSEQHPSSIPPKRARYLAWTSVVGGVGALLFAYAGQVTLTSRDSPPRTTSVPAKPDALPEIPKELESTAADRFVQKAAADELREVDARLVALETLVCALKQNVRDLEERNVRREGGKRGPQARDEFNLSSAAWVYCPAVKAGDKPQQLPSLLKASDSALRR